MDKALAWDLGSAQGAQLCDVTSEILGEASYGLPGSMALLHDGPGLKHSHPLFPSIHTLTCPFASPQKWKLSLFLSEMPDSSLRQRALLFL